MQQTIEYAFSNTLTALINFIPNVIGATVLVLVGIVVSNWARSIAISLLKAIRPASFLKQTTFHSFFKQAEIKQKFEEVWGDIAKWLVLYLFTIAALNVIGLSTVSDFLTSLLKLLPNVLSALLIFVLGILLAGLGESVVKNSLKVLDVSTARFAGKIVSYLILVLGLLIALSELGIGEQFIYIVFIGFVAMISLAFGLAFGMGAKDFVKSMLAAWIDAVKKDQSKS